MTFTDSALVVSWAAIALLGFALAGVLARVHRLERALDGEPAPSSTGGGTLRLPGTGGGPLLALFVDEGCGSCDEAAAALGDRPADGRTRVVTRQEEPAAFTAAGVTATPVAVVADRDLRIVARIPVGSPTRLDEALGLLAGLDRSPSA